MVKDKVELFIEERQDKIVKYIEKVLTQIKNTEVKKIFLASKSNKIPESWVTKIP